jgi:hypothetical protein
MAREDGGRGGRVGKIQKLKRSPAFWGKKVVLGRDGWRKVVVCERKFRGGKGWWESRFI